MKDVSAMTPVPAVEGDAFLAMRGRRAMPVVMPLPSRKIVLGTVDVKQTAAVLLAAGARNVPVAVPGLLATDDLMLFPVAAPPLGYSVGNATVLGAGSATVTVVGPALAIGGTFTIPCRAVVLR